MTGNAYETPKGVGQRARYIRKKRGWTQEVIAGRLGVSNATISQIENKKHHLSRRGQIEDLAHALECTVADLTGEPYAPIDANSARAASFIPDLQLALMDCTMDDTPDRQPRPLRNLREQVHLANYNRDLTRYEIAADGLGDTLTDLQIIVATGVEEEQKAALRAFIEACLVAYEVSKNLGHINLAVEAARRGRDAAQMLGDPGMEAFADWYYSLSLMRAGARRRASGILGKAVDRTAGSLTGNDSAFEAQIYGLLQLTSALEAARSKRRSNALDALEEAKRIAYRTGETNGLRQHFGPTNVAAWTLAIGVELGDGPSAIEKVSKQRINLDVLDSPNRKAAWYFDKARLLAQADGVRDHEAIRSLEQAFRIAPQRLNHDPLVRELTATFTDRSTERPIFELRSLQRRLNMVP